MKKIKMTQLAVALMFVTLGLTVPHALGVAHALTTISFHLAPASAGVASCLPDAKGDVTVLHKEDTLGVDTLHLDVRGLPADTDFAVFLTSADAFHAVFRHGGIYRRLHHERGWHRVTQGRCDHRRGLRQHARYSPGSGGPGPPGLLVRRSGTGSSRLQLDGRYPLRRRWARRTGGDVLGREHRA